MTIDGAFRARVLAGDFLSGFWLNLGSAVTAEMAGLAGFDWVMLDHEHGPGSETTILHQLQAVSATPATCLVRIAANEPPRFKRVLDAVYDEKLESRVTSKAEARRMALELGALTPAAPFSSFSRPRRSTAFTRSINRRWLKGLWM